MRGEKSGERMAQRNGFRERDWQTRASQVELKIGFDDVHEGQVLGAFAAVLSVET